jgi:GNAT superfamily N-acetyltransferase
VFARRSGGIGRRASLRGWCPQGRGGSSPPSDTIETRLLESNLLVEDLRRWRSVHFHDEAVDSRRNGHGLGAAVLKHVMLKAFEVAHSGGVRVLLIHAKDDDARSFYAHYGFVESPFDPLVLMMC